MSRHLTPEERQALYGYYLMRSMTINAAWDIAKFAAVAAAIWLIF